MTRVGQDDHSARSDVVVQGPRDLLHRHRSPGDVVGVAVVGQQEQRPGRRSGVRGAVTGEVDEDEVVVLGLREEGADGLRHRARRRLLVAQ